MLKQPVAASPTRRLVAYMLRYRRGFALGLGCTVLSTVASLATPWVLKHAVDDLAQGVTGAKLRTYAALILGLALVGGLFRFLMRRIIVGVSRHLEYDLRNDFFARTLLGPGGSGKTRLAIETASRLQAVFADGVYFVPLAPANSTRFIVPVIADAIGFAFDASASRGDPKTQLSNYLKGKQALLLPDNLEHLLSEPGIELLAELLANAPQVQLLATSRESAGLQDEWVYEVQGLPIPESKRAEENMQDTSVELFLQRARRAHVGFSAKADDYPAIVRICQLVDGMPLGIELAAAWVRTLSCDEIAKEIEGGLDFLSVSVRDLPARHRSMRAVFDHSWKLLAEEEQGILPRFSVFRGGFRREAAEQVAGATLEWSGAPTTRWRSAPASSRLPSACHPPSTWMMLPPSTTRAF